jgi:hypothetical protein
MLQKIPLVRAYVLHQNSLQNALGVRFETGSSKGAGRLQTGRARPGIGGSAIRHRGGLDIKARRVRLVAGTRLRLRGEK